MLESTVSFPAIFFGALIVIIVFIALVNCCSSIGQGIESFQ
jgi:hypothetical protein